MGSLQFHAHTSRAPKRFPRAPVRRLPAKVWKLYSDRLQTFIIDKWRIACQKIIIDKLPAIQKQVELERPSGMRTDSWPDELTKQFQELSDQYDIISKQSKDIAAGTFQEINGVSHKQWYDIAKKVMGVDVFSFEPWIASESKAFIHVNTDLITRIQSDVQSDVSRIVMGGFRQGMRWESISDQLLNNTDLGQGVFNKASTRADLVARDQSLKLYADLGQKRQENAGLTLYIWRTMEDERVGGAPGGKYAKSRPSHACMDGKVCSWDKPEHYADSVDAAIAGRWKLRASMPGGPGQNGSPGSNRPNCRCYGDPIFETLFQGK